MWIFFFPMSLSVNALASLVATWFLNVNSVKIQHLHLFFLLVKTGFYHATMSSLVYGHLVLRVADSHHPLGDKPKKLKTLKLCKGSFFFLCKQTKQKWNFTILKSKLQFNANLSNSTDTLLIAKLLLQITHNSMELSAQTTSWVCWDQWKELMYVSHCCLQNSLFSFYSSPLCQMNQYF